MEAARRLLRPHLGIHLAGIGRTDFRFPAFFGFVFSFMDQTRYSKVFRDPGEIVIITTEVIMKSLEVKSCYCCGWSRHRREFSKRQWKEHTFNVCRLCVLQKQANPVPNFDTLPQ